MINYIKSLLGVGTHKKPTLHEILEVFTITTDYLEEFKKDQAQKVEDLTKELEEATEDLGKATRVHENIRKIVEC